MELLKIYEAKCTLASLCVSKNDCIAVNHKINIFYIIFLLFLFIKLMYTSFPSGNYYIFSSIEFLKYLDVQKTSPNKKKMCSFQYKEFRFILVSTVTHHKKYLWLTKKNSTIISTCKKTMCCYHLLRRRQWVGLLEVYKYNSEMCSEKYYVEMFKLNPAVGHFKLQILRHTVHHA